MSVVGSKSGKRRLEDHFTDEALQLFGESMRLSEADRARVFSEDELKQLCVRRICQVEMWRWNPVDDFEVRFREAGRLKDKSDRYKMRLLAKAVNRHKSRALYDDRVVKEIRDEEWRLRKKESILSLELWKYDEEQEKRQREQMQYPLNNIIFPENSEGVSQEINQLSTTSVETYLDENENEAIASPEYSNVEYLEDVVLDEHQIAHQKHDDEQEAHVSSTVNSLDDLKAVQSSEGLNDLRLLYKQFDVNTESLTINQESIEEELAIASQEVFETEYEDFNDRIPMTSTQSQSNSQPKRVIAQRITVNSVV